MNKRVLIPAMVIAILLTLVLPVTLIDAATTGSVGCTVTAKMVSVTLSGGSIDYGSVAVGQTKDTSTLGKTQTVTNDGNVTEHFYIKSSDATHSGGTDWTLAATTGANQYTHKYKVGSDDWAALTTSLQSLAAGVNASSNVQFDLQIGMPTSVTDAAAHNITVTITATE
jgi:hypothetical protein